MSNKRVIIAVIFIFISISTFSQSRNENIVSKKYTYITLSPYQKQLLDDFIEDEFPKGTKLSDALTDHTSLRSKTRLAEALLFRNQADDKDNAIAIIKWILSYQYQDENSKNYGIWRTNVVGDRFDQNWREFIGCDLIIMRQKYSHLLPTETMKGIEVGLIHAARGALKRNVGADYTNISIMSAFLMEYVGTEFKMDELKYVGLKKARDIFTLYQKNKTFSEYNSPTYYGVTLIAIALWRELAFSAEMKEMGKTLEKEFWHEVATFYNPNLKNMPGPYFRGYGMDMQKYFAITGIWIAVAVDNEKQAPIPATTKGAKYGERSNIAPIFNLGLAIPKADLLKLKSFSKPEFLSRTVPNNYKGDSLKKVTAIIYKDWMMGGLWGNRRVWGQIKTGTIHWKTTGDDVGWLMVPGDGQTNVQVDQQTMKVFLSDPNTQKITLYLYAKNAVVSSFTDELWNLPNMNLGIKTSLKRITTEMVDSANFQKQLEVSEQYTTVIKVVYVIPTNWNSQNTLIEITPKKQPE